MNLGFPFDASWLLSAPPPLDNVAVPPSCGTPTDQTDPPSRPSGQLVLPTTTAAPDGGQSPPTTEPLPAHFSHASSFDTGDSNADFTISLLKPLPTLTQGRAVILPRIETNVYLVIILPSKSWNAIQLPLTKSVTSDDSSSIGGYKPLLLVIIVRGATTGQECSCVCEQCEKRTGNKIGPPSLIDFHSPSNIITPRGGTIQVHFTFSCYSRHHQKEDEEYVLEVILKDASNPLEPIEVARKELPYSFDVRSTKGLTSHHTQQANIGSSSSVRRKAKRPCPAATLSPAQLVAGPHPEDVERQIRRESVAAVLPDCERAGQRTNLQPEQQGLSDLQRLPSVISPSHTSTVPNPPLLVQSQHGPSGGEERDRLEFGQFPARLEFTPSASGVGAQHISGQSYDTSNNLGQQALPLFAHAPNPSFIRDKVADREVQIDALEKIINHLKERFDAEGREKDAALQPLIEYLYSQILTIQKEITDRLYAFTAERQKAGAVVSAEVENLEEQIRILKQENYRDASILTTITDAPSWIE